MASETTTALRADERHDRRIDPRHCESGIRSILFHAHQDDQLDQRLQAALSIARACSAHLQVVNVVPIEAYTITDSYGGMFVSSEIGEVLEQEAAQLRQRIERQLSAEDVSWDYFSCTSVTVNVLAEHAALADLVVLGRQPRERDFGLTAIGLAGELLHRSHTPLFIPAPGKATPDLSGKAVIAWNGSFEAANAVRSLVGLLRLASDVRVVRYTEPEPAVFPDTRLLEYLSRHGICAQLEERAPHGDISANLAAYALAAGASYLVMGGYGHRRMGEFLYGGVTRDLLRESPVSLVVAH